MIRWKRNFLQSWNPEINRNKIIQQGFLFIQILILCSPALIRIHGSHLIRHRYSFSYLKCFLRYAPNDTHNNSITSMPVFISLCDKRCYSVYACDLVDVWNVGKPIFKNSNNELGDIWTFTTYWHLIEIHSSKCTYSDGLRHELDVWNNSF